MAWYNPTSWDWGDVKNAAKGAAAGALVGGPVGFVAGGIGNAATGGRGLDRVTGAITEDPGADQERERKRLLYEQAMGAGRFADQQQIQFANNQAAGQRNVDALQSLASGANSVSAEQLRQGNMQALAEQRSLAAGASPQNAAGAARTAAIQSGRIAGGLAGHQAVAGLQERNQAQQALTGAIGQFGSQALQATQGARGQAIQGYGAGNAGAPEKSWIEKYGPAIEGGISAASKLSDERVKTNIRDGSPAAEDVARALQAAVYEYKDPRNGRGPELGVTAQGLERAGLGHVVANTPAGKVVKAGPLSTANTAMIAQQASAIAALQKRLDEINNGKALARHPLPTTVPAGQFGPDVQVLWPDGTPAQRVLSPNRDLLPGRGRIASYPPGVAPVQ